MMLHEDNQRTGGNYYVQTNYNADGKAWIDSSMVLLIHFLNTHGFTTKHCCGGHIMSNGWWNGAWHVGFDSADPTKLSVVCDRLNKIYFGHFRVRWDGGGDCMLELDPYIKGMNQQRLLDVAINVLLTFQGILYD